MKGSECKMVGICCGVCHVELKDEDYVIMDDMNGLKHQSCYDIRNPHFIKEVGTFTAIKEKYPFFNEEPLEETIRLFFEWGK